MPVIINYPTTNRTFNSLRKRKRKINVGNERLSIILIWAIQRSMRALDYELEDSNNLWITLSMHAIDNKI